MLAFEHGLGVKVHLTVFYDFYRQMALEIQQADLYTAIYFYQAVLLVMEMPVLNQFQSHLHAVYRYLPNYGDQKCSEMKGYTLLLIYLHTNLYTMSI